MAVQYEQVMLEMQGVPGAGKSRLASGLAPLFGAVIISTDEIGAAMWDDVRDSRSGDNKVLKYKAMRYAVGTVLEAGHSVIIDAQHSKVEDRLRFNSLVGELPILPVITWVQEDPDLALERVLKRGRTRRGRDEVAADIALSMEVLEMPTRDEHMITISGDDPLEKQTDDFFDQLDGLPGVDTSLLMKYNYPC